MKKDHNDQRHSGYSGDRSNQKSYDDYNIMEPSPDFDFCFLEEEDDELSDFALMDNAKIQDYEE